MEWGNRDSDHLNENKFKERLIKHSGRRGEAIAATVSSSLTTPSASLPDSGQ